MNLSPRTPGTWQELTHRFIWHGSWSPVPLASMVEFPDPLVMAFEVTLTGIQVQFVAWENCTTRPVELVVGKPGVNPMVYCRFQLRSLPSVIGIGSAVTLEMEMICWHLQLVSSVTGIGSYLYMCRITFKASCVFLLKLATIARICQQRGTSFIYDALVDEKLCLICKPFLRIPCAQYWKCKTAQHFSRYFLSKRSTNVFTILSSTRR